jgi:hypothetical protein
LPIVSVGRFSRIRGMVDPVLLAQLYELGQYGHKVVG